MRPFRETLRTLWRRLRGLPTETRTDSRDAMTERGIAEMLTVKAKLGAEFFKPGVDFRHRIERANTLTSREFRIAQRCGWL